MSGDRPSAAGNVLLLTVGTGDLDNLEDTLIVPIRKSIGRRKWVRVILLPSTKTATQALAALQTVAEGISPETIPLSAPDDEEDPDRCFAHFDGVIAKLLASGLNPRNIVIDFTRGTKAMSAALLLAAARHRVSQAHYVTGQRDTRGIVLPGKERIASINMNVALARAQLDVARELMRQGNFAAVETVLTNSETDRWPQSERTTARQVRRAAAFSAAWDRLDYPQAARLSLELSRAPAGWNTLWPQPQGINLVHELEHVTTTLTDRETPLSEKAELLRTLAADLVANGLRRIRLGQFEDAVIRAYRVVELVAQVRLFVMNLDPERLDARASAQVASFIRNSRPSQNRDGTYQLSRSQALRLLSELGDSVARRLSDLMARTTALRAETRNQSVLIHGYAARAPNDRRQLDVLFRQLSTALTEESISTEGYLAAALSLNSFSEGQN